MDTHVIKASAGKMAQIVVAACGLPQRDGNSCWLVVLPG